MQLMKLLHKTFEKEEKSGKCPLKKYKNKKNNKKIQS